MLATDLPYGRYIAIFQQNRIHMIKVKINKNTKTAFIIDDAESTPGASRTLTAFRLNAMPKINDILMCKAMEFDWLSAIYTSYFTGDGLHFIAIGIQYEDDNEIVLNFDQCENIHAKNSLDWIDIGQYILAFCLGGVVGTLMYWFG